MAFSLASRAHADDHTSGLTDGRSVARLSVECAAGGAGQRPPRLRPNVTARRSCGPFCHESRGLGWARHDHLPTAPPAQAEVRAGGASGPGTPRGRSW